MPAVESNVYALWCAKQTAKGTPVTAIASGTAGKRVIQVGGDIDTNREDGSENFSDLDRFGDSTDFVNTLSGGGSPVIEAQSDVVAYIAYLFFGSETFAAKVPGTSPPKFTFEPGASAGFWSTWFKRVGLTQIIRHKFNDCRITSLRIEGSTANKVLKITPTIASLDPGEIYSTDPVVELGTQEPFFYTEGEGRFAIGGTVLRGHTQFAIVIDFAESPYYGDSVKPLDVFAGNARVTLEGVTLVLDADGIAQYNKEVYGSASPAAGTKPLTNLPSRGTYVVDLRKTKDANGVARAADAIESLKIEVGEVKWSPDVAIPPAPDGGLIEIALAGEMRKNAAGGAAPTAPKLVRLTVETGLGDNTAHV